jgi:hypothetical protein
MDAKNIIDLKEPRRGDASNVQVGEFPPQEGGVKSQIVISLCAI